MVSGSLNLTFIQKYKNIIGSDIRPTIPPNTFVLQALYLKSYTGEGAK